MTAAFRLPTLRQQFDPRDATSAFDCCAASAATLADADSLGRFMFTHSQVRRATNEPEPAAGSPGLNWTQVDNAVLRLTGRKVDLDVHPLGSPFAPIPRSLVAGKWAGLAIWRGVLVDAGLGHGNVFREGHAVVLGYNPQSHKPILGDPLVDRWTDISWTLAEAACRSFAIRSGAGVGVDPAYYVLTRDVVDEPAAQLKRHVLIEAGTIWRYRANPSTRRIVGLRTRETFHGNTSAPCEAPDSFSSAAYGSRKLVRVTAGRLAGSYVEPGSTHVRVEVMK